jgi:RNA polymerase sigma-70 factor (ECF subfamily)
LGEFPDPARVNLRGAQFSRLCNARPGNVGSSEVMTSALDGFRAAAPARFAQLADDELDRELAAALETGKAAWPTVTISAEGFYPYLAARLPEADTLAAALASLGVSDLYLACGCLQGLAPALAAFETAFASEIRLSLARFSLTPAERDDLRQSLREAFFAARSLAKYSGRGKLRAWVRTIAIRAGLDHVDAEKPRASTDDDQILASLRATGDAELDVIRQNFRTEFETAFRAALESLSGHERTLLLQHYIDRLSIDQLALHHGAHRATAARWIVGLRDQLLRRTREILQRQLHISRPELESLMRIARSQFHISVFRLLKSA